MGKNDGLKRKKNGLGIIKKKKREAKEEVFCLQIKKGILGIFTF